MEIYQLIFDAKRHPTHQWRVNVERKETIASGPQAQGGPTKRKKKSLERKRPHSDKNRAQIDGFLPKREGGVSWKDKYPILGVQIMRTTILVWKNCPLKIKITNWGQYNKKNIMGTTKTARNYNISKNLHYIYVN